jgi:glutathione peroxidase
MSVYEIDLQALDGSPLDLRAQGPRGLLIVNVASQCGLTPQYEALQSLHVRYRDRGFAVVGAPCNQFGEQEPGSAEEIASFCEANYGVEFPLTEKLEVNGSSRHRLFARLCDARDADGEAGDVTWNFEKFVVDARGSVVARFRPLVTPDDPQVTGTIEKVLG